MGSVARCARCIALVLVVRRPAAAGAGREPAPSVEDVRAARHQGRREGAEPGRDPRHRRQERLDDHPAAGRRRQGDRRRDVREARRPDGDHGRHVRREARDRAEHGWLGAGRHLRGVRRRHRPQWRAGVWVSAFVAATTLDKDLTDFTFSATSGGYIDGASASGLMAGGFLAAMTGAPIDPTATMTGIINPDGTIGPVGGIPEKFARRDREGQEAPRLSDRHAHARSRRRPARTSTSSSSRRSTAPRRSRSPTSTRRTSCSPASRCPSRCPSPRPTWRSTTDDHDGARREVQGVAAAARDRVGDAPAARERRPPAAACSSTCATTRSSMAEAAEELHKQGLAGGGVRANARGVGLRVEREPDLRRAREGPGRRRTPRSPRSTAPTIRRDTVGADQIGDVTPTRSAATPKSLAAFRTALRGRDSQTSRGAIAEATRFLDSLHGQAARRARLAEVAEGRRERRTDACCSSAQTAPRHTRGRGARARVPATAATPPPCATC